MVPKPEPQPGAVLFAAMCKHALSLAPNDGVSWWHGMASSSHPKVSWVFRRLTRYRGRDGNFKGYLAYIVNAIPPTALVECLETLHDEGFLDRKQTTGIQERIFSLMRNGQWA